MCLDPEAVILAGGVAAAGELLRAPTEASLRSCLVAREHVAETSVVLGSLGAVAGAVGAGTFGLIRGWGFGGTGRTAKSDLPISREQVGGGPDTWASFSAYQRRQRREGDHRAHRPRCDRRRAPERSASSHSRQPRGGGSLRRTYCRLCTPGDGEPVRCDPSLSRGCGPPAARGPVRSGAFTRDSQPIPDLCAGLVLILGSDAAGDSGWSTSEMEVWHAIRTRHMRLAVRCAAVFGELDSGARALSSALREGSGPGVSPSRVCRTGPVVLARTTIKIVLPARLPGSGAWLTRDTL